MKKRTQINNGIINHGGNISATNIAVGEDAKVIQEGNFKNMSNHKQNHEETSFENFKFENSQVASIGNENKLEEVNFNQQNNALSENIDFQTLKSELQQLRENLVLKAKEPEHFNSIAEIVNAEKATEEKDGNKVIKHLKSAGSWVLDTARELGIQVTTELITKQMGI